MFCSISIAFLFHFLVRDNKSTFHSRSQLNKKQPKLRLSRRHKEKVRYVIPIYVLFRKLWSSNSRVLCRLQVLLNALKKCKQPNVPGAASYIDFTCIFGMKSRKRQKISERKAFWWCFLIHRIMMNQREVKCLLKTNFTTLGILMKHRS